MQRPVGLVVPDGIHDPLQRATADLMRAVKLIGRGETIHQVVGDLPTGLPPHVVIGVVGVERHRARQVEKVGHLSPAKGLKRQPNARQPPDRLRGGHHPSVPEQAVPQKLHLAERDVELPAIRLHLDIEIAQMVGPDIEQQPVPATRGHAAAKARFPFKNGDIASLPLKLVGGA